MGTIVDTSKLNIFKMSDEHLWLVRSAQSYLTEFKTCSSFRGRFNEKYVYGKVQTERCKKWEQDYKSALHYEKTGDVLAAESIINNELERRKARIEASTANDIWEYRSEPPDGWNDPLPDVIKNRLPIDFKTEIKDPDKKSMCVIS